MWCNIPKRNNNLHSARSSDGIVPSSVLSLLIALLVLSVFCMRMRFIEEVQLLVLLAMAAVLACSYHQQHNKTPGSKALGSRGRARQGPPREPEVLEQGEAAEAPGAGWPRRAPAVHRRSQQKLVSLYKHSQQEANMRYDGQEPAAEDSVSTFRGESQQSFEQALASGAALDERFFASAVESMDEVALRRHAAETLRAMRRLELVPGRAMQNRIVRAFYKRPLPEDVAEAFWTLRAESGALGKVAHWSLMAAFERTKPERTLELYEEMAAVNIKMNRNTCNSVLCALCQLGQADRALNLFKQMAALGETDPAMMPNGKSYGSVLHACAESGKYTLAIFLFDRMVKEGVEPNRFAYSDVIMSCVRLNRLPQAMLLYEEMRRNGVPPCDNTHRLLVRSCHLRGMHKERVYLSEQFKQLKMAEAQVENAESVASSDPPTVEGNSD